MRGVLARLHPSLHLASRHLVQLECRWRRDGLRRYGRFRRSRTDSRQCDAGYQTAAHKLSAIHKDPRFTYQKPARQQGLRLVWELPNSIEPSLTVGLLTRLSKSLLRSSAQFSCVTQRSQGLALGLTITAAPQLVLRLDQNFVRFVDDGLKRNC